MHARKILHTLAVTNSERATILTVLTSFKVTDSSLQVISQKGSRDVTG